MRIAAIGRARPGPERDLIARYAGRLRPAPDLVELPDGRGAPAEIKRREGQALLEACGTRFVVALDQGGRVFGSDAFAQALEGWRAHGRELCFVLGGAEGLEAAVVARADALLSLGAMTWPHLLARAMLLEQLYRAQTIATNHPYHRAGRP